MDDGTKVRTFMRGETKNAKAEELLAILKAERELSEIESTEIPNTLKKQPLLPAIRQASMNENSLCYETAAFPVTAMNSRFLWKDLDWNEKDNDNLENKKRRNSESLITQTEQWSNPYENKSRNLPPLKTGRRYSQGVVRPGCPEPPVTPCFND